MSHFTVLVIGEDIEEQLAPYYEQTQDKQYSAFEDTEEENLTEYHEGEVELVVLADGSLYHQYEDCFKQYNRDSWSTDYVYPKDSSIRSGKYSELYPTFEDFMKNWHGRAERDAQMGRYGYWHNPNSKWDWYTVGGRWTGFFKPKAGATGYLGEPGSFNNEPLSGWVDSIQIKDIDIVGMQAHVIKIANETYDKLENTLQDRALPSWNQVREKHGEDLEAARTEYNSLQVVRDLNKADFWAMGDLVETFGNSRQEYINKQVGATMVPFAVVKDGQWYQRGEMGWFGMCSDEMTKDEWNQKYWEMINALDPDTTLTLIDCHI